MKKLEKLRDELAQKYMRGSFFNSEESFCQGFDAATKELMRLVASIEVVQAFYHPQDTKETNANLNELFKLKDAILNGEKE